MGIGKVFAIGGGLLVGAIGAYNFSTSGCVLGGCSADADAETAQVTLAAGAESDDCGLCGDDAASKCEDQTACTEEEATACEGEAQSSCAGEQAAACAGEANAALCAEKTECDPANCEEVDCDPANCDIEDCDPTACPQAVAEQVAEQAEAKPQACQGEQAGACSEAEKAKQIADND